jgi:hypothetical protein
LNALARVILRIDDYEAIIDGPIDSVEVSLHLDAKKKTQNVRLHGSLNPNSLYDILGFSKSSGITDN